MSIVEKAVNANLKNKPTARSREDSFSVRQVGRAASGTESVSRVIDVHDLSARGVTTVLENKELASSFKFLKRSVLATVFGPPGSQTEPRKVVMITSAMPGSGKSFMALNLAASIAQEQLVNVILIDADIVRHNLTSILGLCDSAGLIETLIGNGSDQNFFETSLTGLRFLPAGRHHSHGTELLASGYMSDLLSAAEDPDTIIILDTTPLLVASEADAMAGQADHIFVVVEVGTTSVSEIDNVLQMLDKSGARISFIMNKLMERGEKGGNVFGTYYYR